MCHVTGYLLWNLYYGPNVHTNWSSAPCYGVAVYEETLIDGEGLLGNSPKHFREEGASVTYHWK